MLDEVDALIGDTLISLLRQIQAGYAQRPQAFPQSIILCGVRDVRDYRIHTKNQEVITGGRAFNIKAESLRMGSFEEKGFYGEVQKVVLELKILRNTLDKTIDDGVVQVADYARRIGTEEAYLVIFDRDPEVDWETRIWEKSGFQDGDLPVSVWGC